MRRNDKCTPDTVQFNKWHPTLLHVTISKHNYISCVDNACAVEQVCVCVYICTYIYIYMFSTIDEGRCHFEVLVQSLA
jgi:hypothetical protein